MISQEEFLNSFSDFEETGFKTSVNIDKDIFTKLMPLNWFFKPFPKEKKSFLHKKNKDALSDLAKEEFAKLFSILFSAEIPDSYIDEFIKQIPPKQEPKKPAPLIFPTPNAPAATEVPNSSQTKPSQIKESSENVQSNNNQQNQKAQNQKQKQDKPKDKREQQTNFRSKQEYQEKPPKNEKRVQKTELKDEEFPELISNNSKTSTFQSTINPSWATNIPVYKRNETPNDPDPWQGETDNIELKLTPSSIVVTCPEQEKIAIIEDLYQKLKLFNPNLSDSMLNDLKSVNEIFF